MSYRIEYQWAVFRVASSVLDGAEERFVVAIEGGDSNVWIGTHKRAREWEVGMIGTRAQVLKRAVAFASDCERRGLRLSTGPCTPEAYIRKIRRVLDEPEAAPPAWWRPLLRVEESHPAVVLARSEDLHVERTEGDGVEVSFRPEEMKVFFDFVDRFDAVPPWRFAEVFRLPRS